MSKIKADFLLHNAGQLVTVAGYSQRPKRGAALADIGLVENGALKGMPKIHICMLFFRQSGRIYHT